MTRAQRITTGAAVADRQRQMMADALASRAVAAATDALAGDGVDAAYLTLAQYAHEYGRLLAGGANPPIRRTTTTGDTTR